MTSPTRYRTDDDQGLPCPTCEGSGVIDTNRECPVCEGSGMESKAAAKERAAVAAARKRLYGAAEFRSELRTATEVRCVREMDPFNRIVPRFEMREVANGTGGTSLRFTGYASIVDKPYEVWDAFGPYEETIEPGAFTKTLNDGADVNFLVNHSGVTMARTKSGTLQLSADSTGLYSEATLNMSRPDVQIVRAAVEDSDLDEMSFAFRVTRQAWNEDYSARGIQEVNLHQGDVSVVNFGANPHTAGLVNLRSHRAKAMHARLARPSTIALPDYVRAARVALATRSKAPVAEREPRLSGSVMAYRTGPDDVIEARKRLDRLKHGNRGHR